MKIKRVSKDVVAMIGRDGYLHRWTAPRNQFVEDSGSFNESSKSLVERLVEYETFKLSVLSFVGSMAAPDEATLKEESHALQCFVAGPQNATYTYADGSFVTWFWHRRAQCSHHQSSGTAQDGHSVQHIDGWPC